MIVYRLLLKYTIRYLAGTAPPHRKRIVDIKLPASDVTKCKHLSYQKSHPEYQVNVRPTMTVDTARQLEVTTTTEILTQLSPMQLKTLHKILSSPLSTYYNPEKTTKDPDYGHENMLTSTTNQNQPDEHPVK